MAHPEYRKLRMHLPRQPLARQRPWLIAGFVLVLVIVLIAAHGYFSDKKRSEVPERQKKLRASVLCEVLERETGGEINNSLPLIVCTYYLIFSNV